MEYSKEFVTAVVLGKDLVPRRVASHKSLPLTTILASHSCLLGASPSDSHLPRESQSPQSPQSERTGGPTLPELRTHPCPPIPLHDTDGVVFSFLWLPWACPSAPTRHTPPSPWPGQADTRLASFPRIGLSQLEGFRRQLLDVLQRSTKPKVSPPPLNPLGHAGLAQSTREPSHVRPGSMWLMSREPRAIKLSVPPHSSCLPYGLSLYRGGNRGPEWVRDLLLLTQAVRTGTKGS